MNNEMGLYTLEEAREETLKAFNDDFYFNHQKPYGYTDFIDGEAWVGLCCGASYLVGDTELALKCEGFLKTLIKVGPEARNFAPLKVNENWTASETMPGYWYRNKPQNVAGPIGVQFAINCGAQIENPYHSITRTRWLRMAAWPYGYLNRYIGSWFRQFSNSMVSSFLLVNSKPPKSMEWMAEENPFFSYIFKKKCDVAYPPMRRFEQGETVTRKEIQPLSKTKPNSWVFRRDPFDEYVDNGSGALSYYTYTPIAQVVGGYLQSLL